MLLKFKRRHCGKGHGPINGCLCGLMALGMGACEEYLPAVEPEPEPLPEIEMPQHRDESQEYTYPVKVVLPKKIYAVTGDTLQLFFRGMIASVDPYRYDILVTCAKGKKFPRYFEYTPQPGDIGEIPFSVTLRDDRGEVMGYAESVLEVVDRNCIDELHIVPFGDSLTSEGIWCHHAAGLLPKNVRFCGAREYCGTHYFAVGGWSWSNYITSAPPEVRFYVRNVDLLHFGDTYTCDNGHTYTVKEINVTGSEGNVLMVVENKTDRPGTPSGVLMKISGDGDERIEFTSFYTEYSNPLWEGDRMTFRPYIDRYADGRVDAVYAFMGWNEIHPWQTDFSWLLTEVDRFCTTFHEEYPEARVYVMGLQLPSLNGGIGNSYGATGEEYADGYGLCVSVLNLNEAYQRFAEARSGYVEFLNVSCQFDSEYNMQSADKRVNKYNPETEPIGTNGVHPNVYGYYQIGDVVMRSVYGMGGGKGSGVPMITE